MRCCEPVFSIDEINEMLTNSGFPVGSSARNVAVSHNFYVVSPGVYCEHYHAIVLNSKVFEQAAKLISINPELSAFEAVGLVTQRAAA